MSAKSKDTTKTAHVMNLLRKNPGGGQTADPAAKPEMDAQQTEPVSTQSKPAPVQHPIIASLNEEAAVSLEIKDALEQELMNDEPSAGPAQEPAQTQEPAQLSPAQPEEGTRTADAPAPEEEEPESAPAEADLSERERAVQTAPPPENKEPGSDMEIYNVMQVMVEESAEKYMTMFGLCSCPRCKADVRALALNSLQPKYVVMRPGEYIPRITVYERQFAATVTAQILRACKVVAELPRHDDMC